MSNHSENKNILPSRGDKSSTNLSNQPPDTPQSSAYSLNYYQKITKALFPYASKKETVETNLNDNHGFLVDSLIAQIEVLRDLGSKINGNEDIEGYGLAGFAQNLTIQLKVLAAIQNEYHTQVKKQKEQHQKIVSDYERTITMLKGGDL